MKIVEREVVKRVYGLEEIREAFGEAVKGLSDNCLLPLIEATAEIFYQHVSKNALEIGITDVRYVTRRSWPRECDYVELVVGGKIIDMQLREYRANEVDGPRVYVIGGLHFSGPKEAQVEAIYSVFKKFAAEYGFDKLKAMAAERLKERLQRGTFYHFDKAMKLFYLLPGPYDDKVYVSIGR